MAPSPPRHTDDRRATSAGRGLYAGSGAAILSVDTLLILLLLIFAGVALMVVLGEKFAKPMEPGQLRRITRWILPLVGLSIVIQLLYTWMN